jgi:hypothetical protein
MYWRFTLMNCVHVGIRFHSGGFGGFLKFVCFGWRGESSCKPTPTENGRAAGAMAAWTGPYTVHGKSALSGDTARPLFSSMSILGRPLKRGLSSRGTKYD